MRNDPENVRREWRIADARWEDSQPWLPPRTPPPLAGVFRACGEQGLAAYAALQGMAWAGLAMAGAMPHAPLGGEPGGWGSRTPRGLPRGRRLLGRWAQTVGHALGFRQVACASHTSRQSGLLG
jgi:hypothetical protein